ISQDLQEVDLAIEGAYVITMDENRALYPKGTVLVQAGKIVAIAPDSMLRGTFQAKKYIEGEGLLIMPGMVNTHTHVAMTLFRGLADDLPLQTWLEDFIWPAEARFMDSLHVRLGTRLALAEMIKGGVTTFCDMYFFADGIAEETRTAGMRALIGEGLIDFPTPSSPTPAAGLARSRRFIEQYQGDSLINPILAPHSPYACSDSLLVATRALADSYHVPVSIHLAETQNEDDRIRQSKGMSPTAYLHSLGFLTPGTIAAHSVVLSEADIRLYLQHGVGAAHCPQSNLKLASGIAPVVDLRAAGVPIGLGTDGPTSNNNLHLLEELSLAAGLHKVSEMDPSALPAEEVVAMATIEGAKVLGLDQQIGSIEVGKQADLIAIDLQKPHLTPFYSPYSQVVYAAQPADVQHLWVNGKCLMWNRQLLTLDEQKIMAEVKELSREIYRDLAAPH
ncbi:MAG: amidohydrolase, partial [Bacteroidota bacterium]